MRRGSPPILQAYSMQLQAAKEEVRALEKLGSRYLLGMLEEVFNPYFSEYHQVVDGILWRLNARRVSHTGRQADAYGDRIVGWAIEGPFVKINDKMAAILAGALPIGRETTNFPRGPRSVSVIEELRIPGWESVIALKRLLKGFNMATAGVLAQHPLAAKMRAAIKNLVELNPHLEGIKGQITDYLRQMMDDTHSELVYLAIMPYSFEVYAADQHRLITSIPFSG